VRRAVIALGANLGNVMDALRHARDRVATLPQTRLVAFSSVYASAPQEVAQRQPDYVNAVCVVETLLEPQTLLEKLLAIEHAFGRTRTGWHASRTLDLDLIDFDGQTLQTPMLTLPHPRAHLRAFVLLPLIEIAPEAQLPGHGSVTALLPSVADQPIRRVCGL
jgi:2-amino-4-hydroxy-6-hydroxymethyldihydropteridine diphosphokinase